MRLEGVGGPCLSYLLQPRGGSTSLLLTISNPRWPRPAQFYSPLPCRSGAIPEAGQRRWVKVHSINLRLGPPKGHQFQHDVQVASTRPPKTPLLMAPALQTFSYLPDPEPPPTFALGIRSKKTTTQALDTDGIGLESNFPAE